MSDLVNLGENGFFYLCRICALKYDLPGLPIFSGEGILRDIRKKIQDCLRFTVDETDKCPKSICRDCLFKLDLSHEFLLKSLESQQFLAELIKHEVFDTVYIIKNELQQEFECLQMNELPDQSAIQELEHLVDEVHIHADSNDITQIIQYHDGEINEEEISAINHIGNIAALPKDTDSLPDITLYSFDAISENDENYLPETTFTSIEPRFETVLPATENQIVKPEKVKVTKAPKPPPKVCVVCQKNFPTNYKLNEHMRKHTGDAPFKCRNYECNKSFRSKIGLIQHEANHTGQYKYACEICEKGFQIKSYLTVHMKVHSNVKKYKCSTCGIKMKAKQALIDHENRHLGVKAYQCRQCDQKFISKSLCITHEKSHNTNEISRKFPCPICNKQFVRRSYLKTHVTIHTGNKPFICDICGNKFLTSLDLKQHATTHTGERGYVCEICGKAFARSDALKIHMRSHTGERPYKCKFCGQQFAQITSMNIHVRLHTGEKPYLCTLCPRRFVSRAYLQTHLKKHNTKLPEESYNAVVNTLLAT